MSRVLILALMCFGLWLLLSGHYTPLMLGFGIVSALLVALLGKRMGLADPEGVPFQLSRHIFGYWFWLLKEIVEANIQVARCILFPARYPISPVLLRVKASQRTDLGKVIYANSITMTPGTVSTLLDEDEIEVHALTRTTAQGLLGGDMDRRVRRLEGRD